MRRTISGSTDEMPCVEIKDVNLLKSCVMVIVLGECDFLLSQCMAVLIVYI